MGLAKQNRGFTSPGGRRTPQDSRIFHQSVVCGSCGGIVPDGAHIVIHPAGPDMHVMYCPDHCPCLSKARDTDGVLGQLRAG